MRCRQKSDGDAAARQEAARLAALFGPVLVRSGSRVHPDTSAVQRVTHFVAHFIVVDGMSADHLVLSDEKMDE